MTGEIQTFGLTKRFPTQTGFRSLIRGSPLASPAVDDVSLAIKPGELFGLLGPNGAGKTTLIKMLCTLIIPTSGSACINGYDLSQEAEIKASIGLVTSDERSFYWRLTGRQNLEFFAALHHLPQAVSMPRILEVLEYMDLLHVADQRFLTYSTGIRQRLSIARALLNRPKLLFLDEPTKGLDPVVTQRLHELIREKLVGEQKMTVVLTTHDLLEAESLCDRIAVMNHGSLRACGTLSELRGSLSADSGDPKALHSLFTAMLEIPPLKPTGQAASPPREQLPPRVDKPVSRQTFSLRLAGAFLRRDVINELSYPFAFLLQIASILFSVGIFYFISRLIGSAASPLISRFGGDYFSYVLIGIAFASYFGVGLSSFASNLRQAQTTGTLEAMFATPTSLSTIISFSALWDYLLTTLKVFVYLGIGALLAEFKLANANFLAALLILIPTVVAFSSIGIVAASFIMVLKRGDPITWFFNAVSSFLGGVYYPLEVLPGWMQWLAKFLPITYALEAMRMALLQGASTWEILPQIVVLSGFAILLLPLSLFSFRLAVRRAKTDGSLTHY